ncbi:MAG: hypothetical protein AABX73_03655 [Nanoarchaeota archaeon]
MKKKRKFSYSALEKIIFFLNVLLAFLIILLSYFLVLSDFGRASLFFGFVMLLLCVILRIVRRW